MSCGFFPDYLTLTSVVFLKPVELTGSDTFGSKDFMFYLCSFNPSTKWSPVGNNERCQAPRLRNQPQKGQAPSTLVRSPPSVPEQFRTTMAGVIQDNSSVNLLRFKPHGTSQASSMSFAAVIPALTKAISNAVIQGLTEAGIISNTSVNSGDGAATTIPIASV